MAVYFGRESISLLVRERWQLVPELINNEKPW